MADKSELDSVKRKSLEKDETEPPEKKPHTSKPAESKEADSTTSEAERKKCKTTDESEKPEQDANVHSANDWEHANLGSDDRKNKFLKLMGAGKKDHAGKFVIGDQKPQRKASEDVNEKLEEYYTANMQAAIHGRSSRTHMGLGFAPEPDVSKVKQRSPSPKKEATPETHCHDVKKDHHMHFVSADHKKHVDL